MPELWERLESDTSKSYEAFCIYRDMSKRSLLKAAQEYYGKSTVNLRYIEVWSANYYWQERVQAWDDYQDSLRIEAHSEARKQIIEDELQDYRQQLGTWRKAFERTPLLERTHHTTDNAGNTTEFIGLNISDLHQLTKWRAEIDKQGRLALHLPDKITESKVEHEGAIIIQTGMSMDEI